MSIRSQLDRGDADQRTEKRVDDFKGSEALSVAEEVVDGHGHHCRASEEQDGQSPAKDCRPCYRRGGIVSYQVALP